MFQSHVSDRRHQVRKPAWWMLYAIGLFLVGAPSAGSSSTFHRGQCVPCSSARR
jgi:hypothetical protein